MALHVRLISNIAANIVNLMRNGLWLAPLGIGAAAVIGVLAVLAFRPAEPRYQGRALSQWVRGYTAVAPIPLAECDEALRHIGTNALLFLSTWIQYETPPWKSNVYNLVNPILAHLRSSRPFNDNMLRARADGTVVAFWALDDKGESAIGDLMKVMNDRTHERAASRAAMVLANLGRPACGPLLTAVTNQQLYASRRCYLIRMLASRAEGPDRVERLVPVLQELVHDPDPDVRSEATKELRRAEIWKRALRP